MKVKDFTALLDGEITVVNYDNEVLPTDYYLDYEVTRVTSPAERRFVLRVNDKPIELKRTQYLDSIIIHCQDGGEMSADFEVHNRCDRDAIVVLYKPKGAADYYQLATLEKYNGETRLLLWLDPQNEDYTNKYDINDDEIVSAVNQ
jgi:hypothetical protein